MLITKTMRKTSPGHVRDLPGSPITDLEAWKGKVLFAQPRVPLLHAALGHGALYVSHDYKSQGFSGCKSQPWQFLRGVGREGTQNTRIEVWESLPRIQRMYGKHPLGRSLLQGQHPHEELLVGQSGKDMWGQSHHIEFLLGHCLVELWEKGHHPPDLRLVDSLTTCIMSLEKLQITQHQPMENSQAGGRVYPEKPQGQSYPNLEKATSCISVTQM